MELSALECAARAAGAQRAAQLSRAHARQGGIVHTPPELARFMARAVARLLRSELGLCGLADPELAIVDPACGPGAFLAALAAVHAPGAQAAPAQIHAWDRDANAVELVRARLVAPLRAAGLHCQLQTRDTLCELPPAQVAQLGSKLCVLGNPPWIGGAQPRPVAWLDHLLEDFRRDEQGVRLPERKLGVLADAYVRFVRWASEVARLARDGALMAFVTNASYLDGPVHRGMRGALARLFDRIWIVDLGGNALLARAAPTDENVFGVRPAAAIFLGVRAQPGDRPRAAQIRYTRLLGTRRAKLERLAAAELSQLPWQSLSPQPPYRRFVPAVRGAAEYATWLPLDASMPFNREGVQTNRDAVVVDRDRERLLVRLRAFVAGEHAPELASAWRSLPHYDPERARAALAAVLARDPDGARGLLARPLAYRPFDLRWFAPVVPLCHRPRPELLAAMDHSPIALVTVRKDRGQQPYHHVFAANVAIDNCLLSNRSSCRARAFPSHDPLGRENLAPEVSARYAERLGRVVTSLQFVHYALAILASPAYRRRHQHALQIDYPRIPLPHDLAQFEAKVRAGEVLAALMTSALGPARLPEAASDPPVPSRDGERSGQFPSAGSAGPPPSTDGYCVGHHRPLQPRAGSVRDEALLVSLRARCDQIAARLAELD